MHHLPTYRVTYYNSSGERKIWTGTAQHAEQAETVARSERDVREVVSVERTDGESMTGWDLIFGHPEDARG